MKTNRANLNNGDLIGWRRIPSTTKSEAYLNLVRAATFSDFGHVSIVWNRRGIPGHVEATQPVIRVARIYPGEAYAIRLGLNLDDNDMNAFFHDKLGLKYSMRDALMGYFGLIPKEDNRYQCAELSLIFLRHVGFELPEAYTPSILMRKVLQHTGKPMYYLNE